MAEHSLIEWTDATWNPIRARQLASGKLGWHCTHASEGCRHCYAERINRRLGTGELFQAQRLGLDVEVFLDAAMLTRPLAWREPRRIFVGSMTDLFGEFVEDAWLDQVFAVMALAPQHTFQVLTKRAARMRAYMNDPEQAYRLRRALDPYSDNPDFAKSCDAQLAKARVAHWPLRNVWLGVSAEDQANADARIPELLATPAAVRFVSAEPLLGPINLRYRTSDDRMRCWDYLSGQTGVMYPDGPDFDDGPRLDWVIAGGESGPLARPMHPDWARQLRDDCARGGVSFFFKQWGEYVPFSVFAMDGLIPRVGAAAWLECGRWSFGAPDPETISESAHGIVVRVGKKAAGRLLDGRIHDAMPESNVVAPAAGLRPAGRSR